MSMLKRLSIVMLIALSLIAIAGCASAEVEGEHGRYGVGTSY